MSADKCQNCGAPLAEDARGGLCSSCLFAAAHAPLPPGDAGLSASLPEAGAPPEPSAGGQFALPRRFADYELLEEIARGGMGVAYKARQISLDRIVALKLLLGGALSSPEFVKRFRLEAAAAGGLQHPNIVAVHEVGLHEGQHFIAMDYVDGPNLATVVAHGPLPARRAVGYLKTVAEAIEYAHSKGILHRDLKPSNILLDANDQPRVTDFGLAKKLEGDVDLTVTGQVLGSPNYMPPEQASGQRGNLNRTADVYSLGAILYYLVTGRPPFQAATLATTLEQVRTADPVTPRRLNASLPRDLETICLKCLEKEPERRYPTAQALADELDRFLKGEPIQARPISALGKTWRWCRRKPALATVGAVAMLLLLTLAIGGPIVAAQQRASAERYRRLAYAGDVRAAYDWWEHGNLKLATNALARHVPQGGKNDWREFTWRYVKRLCQPYRQTRSLQTRNLVFSLATTPDGRWLAASGALDFVRVWDLKSRTNAPAKEFQTGGPYFAGSVGFSPGGEYLVTTGINTNRSNMGLAVWDTVSWRCLTNFPRSPGFACDFSPDGKLLAVGTSSGTVLRKVGGDWAEVRQLPRQNSTVFSLRFSREGQKLVTACWDGTAIVWDTASWEPLAVLTNKNAVYAVVLSPDATLVATASGTTVRLWDLADQRVLRSYEHRNDAVALDFSPDGRWLASGGHDGIVKLLDWRNAEHPIELRGHSGIVHAVRFVLGGTVLASGSWDGTVKLWNLNDHAPNDLLEGHAVGPLSTVRSPVEFSTDGSTVATVNINGSETLLWDAASGTLRRRLAKSSGHFQDLAFLPGDETIVAARGSDPPRIEFWSIADGIQTDSFPGQAPICLSSDGRWFACQGTNRGSIQFRDMKNDRTWMSQGGFETSPDKNEFAFSPDGRWLASTGIELVLWDTASGRRLKTLLSVAHDVEPPIRTAVFTPDGHWLIAAGETAEIQVWDLGSLRRVAKFPGHLAGIETLALSQGKTLASGSGDGAVKLWRLEPPDLISRGQWEIRELLTLSEGSADISDLTFSPGGDILGSSDSDGVVRLWRADPTP